MSSTQNVPGVTQPTVKPFPAGANSMRTAGIVTQQQKDAHQMSLIKTAGGRRRKSRKLRKSRRKTASRRSRKYRSRRRRRGGASSSIVVPTFQVQYKEVGAGQQTVNGNATATTKLGATSAANSVYDNCIGQPASSCGPQAGGRRRYGRKRTKRGGYVKWGCLS